MVFAKSADTEHAEPQHMPLFVYPFHDSIVSRGPHETRRLTELHFEVVRFRIKPDFYFFGQGCHRGAVAGTVSNSNLPESNFGVLFERCSISIPTTVPFAL